MQRVRKTAVTATAACLLAAGTTLAATANASATATVSSACNSGYTHIAATAHHGADLVNYCRLWGGVIGVHSGLSASSPIVGYINSANSNWFRGQLGGSNWCSGSYCNDNWAYTMADNYRWGYVSEVYFNSDNTGADPNLYQCTTGVEDRWCTPF
jgi:hypothetical protein